MTSSLSIAPYLTPRHTWTLSEIEALMDMPLMDLLFLAQGVHRHYNPTATVQLASLLSIKTGSCPENCKYCPQSAHYAKKTGLVKEPLMDVADVLEKAAEAKAAGSTRFCMGAAWREVKEGPAFDQVIDMVKGVRALDMEACVTLGMLTQSQAQRLADAGLTAYNHNLDTGPSYYEQIITTRTYEDRLQTLDNVRSAGIQVCCGGIIGMGEGVQDRAEMLLTLAKMTPHPESVPVNALVAVQGTPLENRPPVDALDMVRMIAVTRLVLPLSRIRLSAGRTQMTESEQVLCFLAGANSLFYGDKLLTTPNPEGNEDMALLKKVGLVPEPLLESCSALEPA